MPISKQNRKQESSSSYKLITFRVKITRSYSRVSLGRFLISQYSHQKLGCHGNRTGRWFCTGIDLQEIKSMNNLQHSVEICGKIDSCVVLGLIASKMAACKCTVRKKISETNQNAFMFNSRDVIKTIATNKRRIFLFLNTILQGKEKKRYVLKNDSVFDLVTEYSSV